MTMFTYTEDPPYSDPSANKKAFYRLPRRILLAPYLETNPYFVEFCDAIDEVFDGPIESATFALQNIRNVWATNKETEQKIASGQMIDFHEWGGVDHATNVQQVNNLGFNISTAEAVDDLGYRALAKFIGTYWFSKGKNTAIDFLNYCLGTNLKVTALWTEDYVSFGPYPGDGAEFIYSPGRRTSVDYLPIQTHSVVGGYQIDGYNGGAGTSLQQYRIETYPPEPDAWFPTTHVDILVPLDTKVPIDVIGRLFYEISNYNLVVRNITFEESNNLIVTQGDTDAQLIGLGLVEDEMVTQSTPYYPIAYHSRVGGRTLGVGTTLRQISSVQW